MLSQTLIIQRLALIKQLYKIGVEQSYQAENISMFSLLAFHDSIEMFLKLLTEKENIDSSKYTFYDYWKNISTLTLGESMKNLNLRRVNLKHKGLLPSKIDIEISRVNTSDFFEQNTKKHFDIDFKDVSVTELISYEKVKSYVQASQKLLDTNEYAKCIESIAYAFDELIHSYEENKQGDYDYLYKSPFLFGAKPSTWMSTFDNISQLDRKLGDQLRNIFQSVSALQDSMKIVTLGLDYRKFAKFKILTPNITRIGGERRVTEIQGERKWNYKNCQFCIDFVVEAALKLQEFDFDFETLINHEPYELEYVSGTFETGLEFRKVPKGNKKKEE